MKFLIIIFLLTACNNDKNTNSKISFKIDDKIYKQDSFEINTDEINAVTKISLKKKRGNLPENITYYNVLIEIPNGFTEKTYYYNDDDVKIVITRMIKMSKLTRETPGFEESGSFTITKYDSDDEMISGYFEFVNKLDYTDILISDGKFVLYLDEKNN